jgi:sugar phosphate isomerase/epimerase
MTARQIDAGEIDVPRGSPASMATPAAGDPRLRRLAINQVTLKGTSLTRLVDICQAAGIGGLGLWRDEVAVVGAGRAKSMMDASGIRLTSLCRGGFLTAMSGTDQSAAMDDNRQAIEEAAALGITELVIVPGGLPAGSVDLLGARHRFADAIAELVPLSHSAGVRLALEPMHPVLCDTRGVISTIDQALDIAEGFAVSDVGVVVDSYHVWWDPRLETALVRAGARIAVVQIADWVVPLPADVSRGRAMPGDGAIDLAAVLRLVERAGYAGDIEVEIFNESVWSASPRAVVATVARRFAAIVDAWRPGLTA